MSDNVQSQGYFGKLKTPVGEEGCSEWDSLYEALQAQGLYLNYEGTLVYSDEQSNAYDDALIFAKPFGASKFRNKCEVLGHFVDPVKHYSCVWYNGSDSPMSTATLEEVFT